MAVDVYVSPSTQPHNLAVGGGTEQAIQYRIGEYLVAALRRCGITCHLSGWKQEGQFVNAAMESNRLGARYHHALHSDASGTAATNFTHSIVAPGATEAARVARIIETELSAATGWPSRGVVARDDLYELTQTTAHAVLTESGFHTNPAQAGFLRNNPQVIAEAYARAWCRALSRTYVPPATGGHGGGRFPGMAVGVTTNPTQQEDVLMAVTEQDFKALTERVARIEARTGNGKGSMQEAVQTMANANARKLDELLALARPKPEPEGEAA